MTSVKQAWINKYGEVENHIKSIYSGKILGVPDHYGIFLTNDEQKLLNQKTIYPAVNVLKNILEIFVTQVKICFRMKMKCIRI